MSIEIDVSVEDLIEGRAHIEFPLPAILNLCHWAGAPWADRKPKAHLHPLQVEVLAHRERELIVHGASRLGKSVLGGCEILIALHSLGTKTGVFAHRWDHVAHEFQYVNKGIRRLYHAHPGAVVRNIFRNQGANQQYHAEMSWGSFAKGFSTGSDEGAAALGQEFTHIVLGEGSKIHRNIRERMLQRAIDGALMNQAYPREDIGRFFIFTTPSGYEGCAAFRVDQIRKAHDGDLHALEYGNVPWIETCWVRQANILENPAYDSAAYYAAKRSLSEAAFREQYQGEMVHKSGRVYEEFDEDTQIRRDPDPSLIAGMKLAIGVDTGSYFGAVLVGLDKNEDLWWLREVYTQKKDIDHSCAKVREKFLPFMREHFNCESWTDAAKTIKLLYIDPASQHKLEVKKRLEMTVRIPHRRDGGWDLLPTIDMLRHKMMLGKFAITRQCTWALDQMRKYVWKETRTPGAKDPVIREPRKDYDHVLDAARIASIPLLEYGPIVAPARPLTLAEAQEEAHKDLFWGDLKRQMRRPRSITGEVW